MPLTLDDVHRIARLAQLKLTDDQADKTLFQLNGVFTLAEQMRAIDTHDIEPLHHPLSAYLDNVTLILREDIVTEPNRRTDYLKSAPMTQDGLFLVPKVIE